MIACKYCGVEFKEKHKQQKSCGSPECKKAGERARQATYKLKNPNAQRDASRRYRSINGYAPWPSKKATAIEVKIYKESNPCCDCGRMFPAECMDFDHRDWDSKTNNVGTMVSHGHNKEKIWAEIAKCDLVCSNCHRIRTRRTRLAKGVGPLA